MAAYTCHPTSGDVPLGRHAPVCVSREREREGARRCPRSSVRVPECMRLCHQEGHVWACECVRGTLRDAVKMARVRESTAANQGQVRACVCTMCVCICAPAPPVLSRSSSLAPLFSSLLVSAPSPSPPSPAPHLRQPPSLPALSLSHLPPYRRLVRSLKIVSGRWSS